ncbi:MAG: hypothetical protein WD048_04965 [Chitinophagales bacterium]
MNCLKEIKIFTLAALLVSFLFVAPLSSCNNSGGNGQETEQKEEHPEKDDSEKAEHPNDQEGEEHPNGEESEHPEGEGEDEHPK